MTVNPIIGPPTIPAVLFKASKNLFDVEGQMGFGDFSKTVLAQMNQAHIGKEVDFGGTAFCTGENIDGKAPPAEPSGRFANIDTHPSGILCSQGTYGTGVNGKHGNVPGFVHFRGIHGSLVR